MRRSLAIFTALIFGVAALPFATRAQESPVGVTDNDTPTDYNLAPNTFSFNDMEPIPTSGSFSAPGWGTIAWNPGTRPEQLFTVGMFQDSFGFEKLSLNQISDITGQSVTDASLSSFGLVQNLTVSQLVSLIPQLRQLPVSVSPPIQSLAQQQGIDTAGGSIVIAALSPIIQGNLGQLGSELEEYAISQIPGLEDVTLQQIPDWANAQIADIPGLSSIPLINPFSLKDYFVPFDIPFGMSPCKVSKDCREFNIDNTASGNWKNLSIPCIGGPCSHIEVKRWGGDTNKIRWVSKEHKVPGGNGFLCKNEPTGRFPFGKNPKVVIEKIDEQTGKVDFALYFSISGPFGAESAHCFGPFPMPFWGERKEGQLVLFGLDKPSKKTPLSGLVKVRPPIKTATSTGGGNSTGQPLPLAVDCQGTQSTYIRPSSGRVTSEFGWRIHPILGRPKLHSGIDISGGYNSPIFASNCGTVSVAGWTGGYGKYTCITHNNGARTCYGHQSQILVRVGEAVKRGQVIGQEGSTGNSTGPHLHFEYWINGKAENPRSYVPI